MKGITYTCNGNFSLHIIIHLLIRRIQRALRSYNDAGRADVRRGRRINLPAFDGDSRNLKGTYCLFRDMIGLALCSIIGSFEVDSVACELFIVAFDFGRDFVF